MAVTTVLGLSATAGTAAGFGGSPATTQATGTQSVVRHPIELGLGQVLQTYAYNGDMYWGFDSVAAPDGKVTVVWSPWWGDQIGVATRSLNGTWERLRLTSGSPGRWWYMTPHVASDAAGNLTATWGRENGNGRFRGVFVSWRAARDTTWHTPVQVSPTGAPVYDDPGPDLAVYPDGTTVVTWLGAGRDPFDVWTAVKHPGQSWTNVKASVSARLPRMSGLA